MDLLEQGRRKYTDEGLIQSSAERDWPTVAAELRHHPAGELPPIRLTRMEIGIATACDPACVVTRKGAGRWQATSVFPGAVWLNPAGVFEEHIAISAWHEVLHLYLPPERFEQLAQIEGGEGLKGEDLPYLGGLEDSLIREIGAALQAEMAVPSAGGRLLAEALTLALTVRIAHAYGGARAPASESAGRAGLDDQRLGRVLEYMAEHLDVSIGIDDLARVACLSPFHFARMFAARMGAPPHRYLARLRLDRAKALLLTEAPLSAVAADCAFGSESNFIRAFRRATGTTPGAYRRERGGAAPQAGSNSRFSSSTPRRRMLGL